MNRPVLDHRGPKNHANSLIPRENRRAERAAPPEGFGDATRASFAGGVASLEIADCLQLLSRLLVEIRVRTADRIHARQCGIERLTQRCGDLRPIR